MYSSPVVVGETVYVGEGDGDFSAHDASTGEQRWSYRTGGGIWATPVVHEGYAYVGSDDGFVYAFRRGGSLGVRRAVYFDEAMAPAPAAGAIREAELLRDYLSQRGYEILDADGFRAFLHDEAGLRRPAVVVVTQGRLPEGADLGTYLRAGKKMVWVGYPPGFLVTEPGTNRVVGTDRNRPEQLLDVDFTVLDGDIHGVLPTDEGRRWGLVSRWVGLAGTRPEHVTSTLALDEIGRSAAWVKRYGGEEGSGFVGLLPGSVVPLLHEIQRLAEFGLYSR